MAHLPGNASLVEQLDRRILVVLRDGRHLVGTLRSFDQFSNLVLHPSFERHVVADKYGDIPLGLYIVRGDNIVMLGELDEAREAQMPCSAVSSDEILEAKLAAQEAGEDYDDEEWVFD